MPHDPAVPIGDHPNDDRSPCLRRMTLMDDVALEGGQTRSIDADVRALAERRLKLIADTLDLPSGFFEARSSAKSPQPGAETVAPGAADAEIAEFLDLQDGAPIVEIVARVRALADPVLQARLLSYLSSIDL